MKEIYIVGGGVSGIASAYFIKKNHPDYQVTIIEKDHELGKRIKISGNGRCNFANKNINAQKYFFSKSFISDILENFKDYQDEFYKEIDLHYYADEEGRMYPLSNSSKTVHNLLIEALKQIDVKVLLDESVLSVSDNIIITSKNKYHFDNAVLTSGGASYLYQENAHDIYKDLKLNQTPLIPTLCPVVIKEKIPKDLVGKRVKGLIKLIKNHQVIYEENGELLFKKDGLSGIAIFNISAFLAEDYANLNKYQIVVQIIDQVTKEDLKLEMDKFGKLNTLKAYVVEELALYLNNLNLNPYEALTNLSFSPTALYPFKESQVTKGGIALNEVNEKLELIQHPNIYVGGELLDVNALCGGYNIFFALASAYRIGKSIN